jgi:hypothetical protein
VGDGEFETVDDREFEALVETVGCREDDSICDEVVEDDKLRDAVGTFVDGKAEADVESELVVDRSGVLEAEMDEVNDAEEHKVILLQREIELDAVELGVCGRDVG